MFILKENWCIDSITQKHHVLYDDDCKYNYCYMSRYLRIFYNRISNVFYTSIETQ